MIIEPLPVLNKRVIDRSNSPLTFIDEPLHRAAVIVEYSTPRNGNNLFEEIETALNAWRIATITGRLDARFVFYREPRNSSRRIIEKLGAWKGMAENLSLDGTVSGMTSCMDHYAERGIWGFGKVLSTGRSLAHLMKYTNGLIIVSDGNFSDEDFKMIAHVGPQGNINGWLYNTLLWSASRGLRVIWLAEAMESEIILYEASRRLN